IPQPASKVIRTQAALENERHFPFYLKANYATASTAVWKIQTAEDLKSKSSELALQNRLNDQEEFVVQQAVEGNLERVQAVFDQGILVAIHGYRQMLEGLGGGDVAKLSIVRPIVRRYVQRIGEELKWHGALSMDYIVHYQRQVPLFIDANPRL